MPVHTFVEVQGEEACYCPTCSYTLIPSQLPIWTEADMVTWIVSGNMKESDAKIIVGTWLIAREFLAPSSQELAGRIEDILAAARVAGWLTPEVTGIVIGVDKVTRQEEETVIPRTELLARQYAEKYHVTMDRARAAVLNSVTTAPVPVDAVSARVEAKAREYSKAHGVGMDEAVMKVLAADPGLADAYVRPPIFPSAHVEQTAEQLVGKMTKAELTELLVERKVGLTDPVAKNWSYEWLTGPGGMEYASQAAADVHTAWWEQIQLERFRRHGLSDQQPVGR